MVTKDLKLKSLQVQRETVTIKKIWGWISGAKMSQNLYRLPRNDGHYFASFSVKKGSVEVMRSSGNRKPKTQLSKKAFKIFNAQKFY